MMDESLNIPKAAPVEPKKRRRISFVWLAPLVAALLAGVVAWQTYSSRGPLIEIIFESAAGIEAGATKIRHKNVVVGVVEDVSLSDDFENVVVHARLDKEMASYVGDTTQFWVVNARIEGAQVSGLDTLLSGAYIEMDWSERPSRTLRKVDGLIAAPLTPPGSAGRRIRLRADRAGSLDVGSPVYFRQLPVGRVESRQLSDDGSTVLFDVFVDAPYSEHIRSATRFWNVSGVDINVGADGVNVNVESLIALVSGGVAFGSLGDAVGDEIVRNGTEFTMYASRQDADESLFQVADAEGYRFSVRFDESVSGLQAGAVIRAQGVVVGRVVDVTIQPDSGENPQPFVNTVLQFEPSRLNISDPTPEQFQDTFRFLVSRGMRAQLVSSNILTGALSVQLVTRPDSEPAEIDFTTGPYPTLPSMASDINALTTDFEALMDNLSTLDLNRLVTAASVLLENTDSIMTDPSMVSMPANLAMLTQQLQAFSGNANLAVQGLGPDSPLYVDLSEAITDLRRAAAAVADLAEMLEESPNSLITGR